MDKDLFGHICELSKLEFSDADGEAMNRDMSGIIELMDKIKSIDLVYDDTKDGGEISFEDLRSDISEQSFEREKLLQNTEDSDNCYVVPKLMD